MCTGFNSLSHCHDKYRTEQFKGVRINLNSRGSVSPLWHGSLQEVLCCLRGSSVWSLAVTHYFPILDLFLQTIELKNTHTHTQSKRDT